MNVPTMHFGGAVRTKVDPDDVLRVTEDEIIEKGRQMAREGIGAFRELESAGAEPVPDAKLEHFDYYDPEAGEYVIAWRILCRRKESSSDATH
jgi:hypothetical protein